MAAEGGFYMTEIKRWLKKNISTCKVYQIARNAYRHLKRGIFLVLYGISPVLASRYLYRQSTGKKLNLKNPEGFNEKLQWLKLYYQSPLMVKCADKYGVREYVNACGCKEILNELYNVYDHPSEINWYELPQKFALKCTHGCGFNIICNDKNKLDINQALLQLTKWMKIRYDRYAAEVHYGRIKPRIICEKYLETDAGHLPVDYKIYCFNGKPELVLVCMDRAVGYKRIFLDLMWEKINIVKDSAPIAKVPNKPGCLYDMLQYAERLAKPFPFVRVDFYEYKGKPILGEMTFTPVGCMATYYNDLGLKWLGDMIKLPNNAV